MQTIRDDRPSPRRRALAATALAAGALLLAPAPSSAVIGGKPTAIDAAPWSVALAYSSQRYGGSGHRRYLCGGTLIAPTLVLTAAHCVHKTPMRGLGFAQGPYIEAIVGRARLSGTGGQAIGVESVRYLARRGKRVAFVTGGSRPLFNRRRADYDIALLRLAGPARARPIRLAGRGEARAWRPGARGTVAAWGFTSHQRRQASDRLQSITMRRLGDATCARQTATWRASIKLCARGVSAGRGTCRGDSGSGLAVPVRARGKRTFRLIGITNFGTVTSKKTGCSRGATTFARVSAAPLRSLIAAQARKLGAGKVVGSGARGR